MADVITLTAQPFRITTPTQDFYAPLWSARDVLAYDVLDMEYGVVGFEGSGTLSLKVGLVTNIHNDSEQGWFSLGLTQLTSSAPYAAVQSLSGTFLRYVRWWVQSSTWGTQTAATVWIRGMARTHQEILQGGGARG